MNDSRRGVARGAMAVLLALVSLCRAPTPLRAQLGPIGLSGEDAQLFAYHNPYAEPIDGIGYALAAGDFNGDGVDDLAAGIPRDVDASGLRAGSVVVRFGTRGGGLGSTVTRLEADATRSLQEFGHAVAAGDFDGDGFEDLAVGISHYREMKPNMPGGAVRVYYGSTDGLDEDDYEQLDETVTPEGDQHYCFGTVLFPRYNDFGAALAAGDFDADGYDDLAIGGPGACDRTFSSAVNGGVVYVAHGKPGRLLPFYGYRISQNEDGIYDDAEGGDLFGYALATADFNADGYDDLAIGIPGENDESGAVDVIMGNPNGLIFYDSVFWLPGALGEDPYTGDGLGQALSAGDFDGDGFGDLAIGAPGKNVGGPSGADAGIVDIAYGDDVPGAWFALERTDRLTQSTIYSNASQDGPGDFFGRALAAADFDGDGRADLAIGHPGDDWTAQDLGQVTILMGDVPPLGSSSPHHLLTVGWEGVPGDGAAAHQSMGTSVAVGDFDGSGRSDLAIGVPGYRGDDSSGAIVVLYSANKLFADDFETGDTTRWSAKSP